MTRPVSWSRRALRDIKEQVDFISHDNDIAGMRVSKAIRQTGTGLGKALTGRPGRGLGLFEKSVPKLPFILAYVIRVSGNEETVVILRVIHTARNWPAGGWPGDAGGTAT